jgi:hypothetical protein
MEFRSANDGGERSKNSRAICQRDAMNRRCLDCHWRPYGADEPATTDGHEPLQALRVEPLDCPHNQTAWLRMSNELLTLVDAVRAFEKAQQLLELCANHSWGCCRRRLTYDISVRQQFPDA